MSIKDNDFPLTFDLQNHVFERELQNGPPRPLPAFVGESRHERSQSRAIKAWILAGACLYALAALPFVKSLSYNILPLAYLHYIGPACAAVGLLGLVAKALRLGRYKYLTRGIPLAAGVVRVEKTPLAIYNGEPVTYGFTVLVEARHPETGEIGEYLVKSPGFPTAKKDLYTTPLRPGQVVTALYLPRRFPKSLQLYGFLELNPEIDYIRRLDASAVRQDHPVAALLKLLGLGAIFAALFWDVYAMRYWPLETGNSIVTAAGLGAGLLGAILTLAFLLRGGSRRKKAAAETAAAAEVPETMDPKTAKHLRRQAALNKIILPMAAGLLSAFTVLGALFTINAVQDRSAARYELVKIAELIQTTYDFVYRTYSVKYEYPEGRKREYGTTYERIMEFEYDIGVAEIHRGYFGWPWVRRVWPVQPVEKPGEEGGYEFEIVGMEKESSRGVEE